MNKFLNIFRISDLRKKLAFTGFRSHAHQKMWRILQIASPDLTPYPCFIQRAIRATVDLHPAGTDKDDIQCDLMTSKQGVPTFPPGTTHHCSPKQYSFGVPFEGHEKEPTTCSLFRCMDLGRMHRQTKSSRNCAGWRRFFWSPVARRQSSYQRPSRYDWLPQSRTPGPHRHLYGRHRKPGRIRDQ